MASFTPWRRMLYRLSHVHETSPGTHTFFHTYTCPVYCWRSVQLLDFGLYSNLIHASQPNRTTFTGQWFASGLCVVRWFYSHRVRSFLHVAVRSFLHELVRSSLHRPVRTFLHPLRRVLSQEESAVHPILYTVSSTQERRPLCWQKQKCRKYRI